MPRTHHSSRKVDDTSATNFKITTPFFRKPSNVDSLDLQDEPLDFEPDNESSPNISTNKQNYLDNNDNMERLSSTSQTGTKENDIISNASAEINNFAQEETNSLSSVSHSRYMIPYDKRLDRAEDGRQDEYLHYTPSSSTGPLVMNSSSSSSDFSDGHTSLDVNDDDDGSTQSSLAEYDLSSNEENRLLDSDDEAIATSKSDLSGHVSEEDEICEEEVDDEEELIVSEDDLEAEQPMFQDKTFKKEGLNNIIITIRHDDVTEQNDNSTRQSNICTEQRSGQSTSQKQSKEATTIQQRDVYTRQRDTYIMRENETNFRYRKLKIRNAKKFCMPRTKNWIRYEPYCTRVFLEDIGYIPPCIEYSDPSDDENSMQSVPTVQITINSLQSDDERRCEQIDKSVSQNPAFKMPLPPIKRPPTRPKRLGSFPSNESKGTDSNANRDLRERILASTSKEDNVISLASTFLSNENMGTDSNGNRSLRERILAPTFKEDDAISISASSISQLDHEYTAAEVKDETPYQYDINNDVMPNYSEPYHRTFVSNWISNQCKEPVLPPLEQSSNAFVGREPTVNFSSAVAQGLSKESTPLLQQTSNSTPVSEFESVKVFSSVAPNSGPRVQFSDVPKFFFGICYHFFFNESCARLNCSNHHYINEYTFTKKCKELLSPGEMKSVYKFSLRFHKLFQHIYPSLVSGFGYHKMQNDLFACIDDFFALKDKINVELAMGCVLGALQKTGLSLLEAVESISYNVGFMRHPDLANIMLDYLTRESKIADNWEVIKRIICRSTNFISPAFFERILGKLLISTPINRDLCKDIYNVIIKQGKTNLAEVDPQLLTPIKTLAEFGSDKLSNCIDKNLLKEREIFEQCNNSLHFQPPAVINEDSADSDDRLLFSAPIKLNERREELSQDSPSSSKSGSSRFSQDHEVIENHSDISSQRRNYQYIPQNVNTNIISQAPRPCITVTVPNNTAQYPHNLPNRVVKQTVTNTNTNTLSPVEINIFPGMPIFGQFKFQSGFSFDQSLHHLLPFSGDQQVTMNESDIVKLHDCISKSDGNGFLTLLDHYKVPSTLQHFITMSLAEIRNSHEPYISFVDLLDNIGIFQPGLKSNSLIKGVFEVMAFNLLFYFEKRCNWQDAKKLIESFTDWDSLLTSKQFITKKLTPMGRYIFLARLLSKSHAFYYVYEILQSPDLKLLEAPKNWPLFYMEGADLEFRNSVLSDFFKFAYRYNVAVVCDMYRKFENIYLFDAQFYFNPMLENLINNEKISSLKHFHTDIDIFYKKMDRNILRAFTIIIENQLSFESKMKLYKLGCQKGIYVAYTGRESTIAVRTNMPDNELKLVLQFYFHQLSFQYDATDNLRIEIRLPEGIVQNLQILKSCIRSVYDVNISVRKILSEYFKLNITSAEHDNYAVIEVAKEELRRVIY